MRGALRCAVITGLALAACGDDRSQVASDAAVNGGLVVAWSTSPQTWPGDLGDGLTVDRAVFTFDNVRIVGDAAPGDPRTTASSFELRWDGTSTPDSLAFPDAPGGVYSQLSLLIDGHVAGPSLVIEGHVTLEGTEQPYRIAEDSPVSVTLAIDQTLSPPASTTLALQIDFGRVLRDIDFAMVADSGGTRELATGDPQMPAFRAALLASFSVLD